MPEDVKKLYGENLQKKLDMVDALNDEYEETGHVKFKIEESQKTQAELLELIKKDILLQYCDYAGIRISRSWKKRRLAEAYSSYLQENLWIFLMIIPQESVQAFLRFSKCRSGELLALNSQEECRAIYLMVHQGLLEPYYSAEKDGVPAGFEYAKGMAGQISQYYKDKRNFGENMPAAVYLPPELRAGSWKNICKGYARLDERVRKVLMYYGMLRAEKLSEVLRDCYQYPFDDETFRRFLMLRMRMLDMLQTAYYKGTKERWVALGNFPIVSACADMPEEEIAYRPVSSSQLEEREQYILSLIKPLGLHLLLDYLECSEEYTNAYLEYLISAVQLRAMWEYFSLFLEKMTGGEDKLHEIGLWYLVSNLYLKLPVCSLGGNSRIEYAALHQLENPFELHNDTKRPEKSGKNTPLYQCPYTVQWELFHALDQCIGQPENRFYEKQLEKSARRYMTRDDAELPLLFVYMETDDERLYDYLVKLLERGNGHAERLLYLLYEADTED